MCFGCMCLVCGSVMWSCYEDVSFGKLWVFFMGNFEGGLNAATDSVKSSLSV